MLIGQLLQRLWNVGGAFTCTCNIINRLMSHEYTHSANEYTHLSVWDHDSVYGGTHPPRGGPPCVLLRLQCLHTFLCLHSCMASLTTWTAQAYTALWVQAARQSKIGQGWTWECVDRAEIISRPHRPCQVLRLKFIVKGLQTLTEDAVLCGWNLLFLSYYLMQPCTQISVSFIEHRHKQLQWRQL